MPKEDSFAVYGVLPWEGMRSFGRFELGVYLYPSAWDACASFGFPDDFSYPGIYAVEVLLNFLYDHVKWRVEPERVSFVVDFSVLEDWASG